MTKKIDGTNIPRKRIEYILEEPLRPRARGFIRLWKNSFHLHILVITGLVVIITGTLICSLNPSLVLDKEIFNTLMDAIFNTFIVSMAVFIFTLLIYVVKI